MKNIPALLTAAAILCGCVTPTGETGMRARQIGAFEVGRLPGDVVGMYGAITTGKNKTVFGRVCSIGSCVWIVSDLQNTCITDKKYTTTLSVDNVAYPQNMVCIDPKGTRMFEGDDEQITKLIVGSNQIGITPPVGPAVVFNVRGAAEAIAYLDKR